jgi:Ser/Thr protein kinase RdoA (MazF antagonist)
LPPHRELERLAQLAVRSLCAYKLPRDITLELINLSENATYCVQHQQTGARWALRLHRVGYHSRAAIASEIAWQIALRQDGVVTTPVPVAGRDGEFIQIVSSNAQSEPQHVVLYQWEDGSLPDMAADLSHSFEVLGAITARMHCHSRTWKQPEWFQRFSWDFSTCLGEAPHWGRWQDGMGMDPGNVVIFEKTVQLIRDRLSTYGKGPDRFGLIHSDLRLANLLVHLDEVKVIDFDDCGFGWYMYDAATPFSFYEHLPEVPRLMGHWLKGYRTIIPLPTSDEEEIPTFIMLRRLLLVAWIGSHHDTDLARSMGVPYTDDSVRLCQDYLNRFA